MIDRYSHYWRPWPKALVPVITVLQIVQLATVRSRGRHREGVFLSPFCRRVLSSVPFFLSSNTRAFPCARFKGDLDLDHQPGSLPRRALCDRAGRPPPGLPHSLRHGSGKLSLPPPPFISSAFARLSIFRACVSILYASQSNVS
jgi:hypothetical protein